MLLERLESRLALSTTPLDLDPLAAEGEGENTAHLTIFVDSQQVAIPVDIGVTSNGGRAAVSTESADGQLLSDTGSTLGDFFDTWRTNAGLAGDNPDAVLSDSQLLDNVEDASHTMQMFVNGQVSQDYDDHVIQDGDNIVLVYGDNPVVALSTNFGAIVIELFEDETPGTVDNFLNYVNDGDYLNSIFHRSADSGGSDFVIQGGGFTTSSVTFADTMQFTPVPTDPPIVNEPGISNVRGTVAMAKTSNPDSATSQFFVNLSDSNTFLDDPNNSGGFTVFGQVLDMTAADTIAALPINSSNSAPFGELPLGTNNELVVIQQLEGHGRITGVKYFDDNANGVRDAGEAGLAGVTVYVDGNDNGVLDAGELSTTTDSDGVYLILVEPGLHTLRADVTSGRVSTGPASPDSYNVTVQLGREISDLDFGESEPGVPIAVSDSYSVDEEATLSIDSSSGVLSNDSDPESDALTAQLVASPANGAVSLNSDGSFVYTPDADFSGADSFTYLASDGVNQSSETTVNITVNNVPDPPAAADDTADATVDSPITVDVLDNDLSDANSSAVLTITDVTQSSAGGSVTNNGSDLTYTPPAGFVGTDTFTYTVEDVDGRTATATVTVDVAEAADNSVSGFVYMDLDNDGVRDAGEAGVPGAQITLSGTDNSGAAVHRTILTDGSGAYTFDELPAGTYQVSERQPTGLSDGIDTTTVPNATADNDLFSNVIVSSGESFTENNFGERSILPQYVNVVWHFSSASSDDVLFREAVARAEEMAGNGSLAAAIRSGSTDAPPGDNDAPQAAGDSYSVDEDQTLTVGSGTGVLSNDTDGDGDVLTATVTSTASNGGLTLNSDGSFTYVPDADFNGADTFTYSVSDGSGGSAQATATITVNAVNDPPVAETDSYAVDEDSTLAVDAVFGLLDNDTDAEGDALSAVLSDPPDHGSLTLNADGSFTYEPDDDFSGDDMFSYTASDGSDESAITEVAISVTPIEDPPAIQLPAEFTDPANVASRTLGQTIDFTAGVVDPDDDDYVFQLDLESSGIPQGEAVPTIDLDTGQFLWTPTATGRFEIRIIVVNGDGEADQETFLIDIVAP